ncbi:MAG: hypothetical protein KC486_23600, partial [Myxococcales bacterium]|nr:hypothetical protein [Myxococcales bacterium]
PSASGSMRIGAGASAGASGSRRIVNLVDVRAAGESTSQGRIFAAEAAPEGGRESAANDGGRVDADAATAIASAASTGVDLDASSDSVVGHRPESMASTVLAPVADDDTLSGTGIRPGPSRTAISWALGGIGALVAGSVAIALLSPPEAPPHAAAKASIEESVSLPVEPKRAVVDEAPAIEAAPEAAPDESDEASEEALETPAEKPKKSRSKARKRSTTNKQRSAKKAKATKATKAAKAPEPEEDDVLVQVQKYMREKKEREARQAEAVAKAQAGRSAAPSAADTTAARDRLAQARTAYNSGKYSAAYSLASQSQSLSASADALELMGLASCARGDGDRARQVHRSIAAGRKAKIEARCRDAGIAL